VILRAHPGHSDELGLALEALIEPSRAEPRCKGYEVHRSIQDGDVWMVYECWETADAVDEHLGRPHVQAFLSRLANLVLGEINVDSYDRIAVPSITSNTL